MLAVYPNGHSDLSKDFMRKDYIGMAIDANEGGIHVGD